MVFRLSLGKSTVLAVTSTTTFIFPAFYESLFFLPPLPNSKHDHYIFNLPFFKNFSFKLAVCLKFSALMITRCFFFSSTNCFPRPSFCCANEADNFTSYLPHGAVLLQNFYCAWFNKTAVLNTVLTSMETYSSFAKYYKTSCWSDR